MARCSYCGSSILFGGVSEGKLRFCNANCHRQGYLLALADQIPEDLMAEHLAEVHQGDCPKCGGPGPIDVHTSYSVWSALVLTSWRSNPQVCCRSCGIKAKLGGAVSSGVLGWWGFPWGLFVTPIQVVRNLAGVLSSPNPTVPSAQLENIVRVNLAARIVEANRQEAMRQEGGAE